MSEDWDGVERRTGHWHVAREIPIAVLFTLILQTGTGVWFLASLSAKVDTALETLREFKAERYTRADADRDRAAMQAAHADITRRIDRLEAVAHPEEPKTVGRLTR